MTSSQIELLNYLSEQNDEGAISEMVAEEFDITEVTANKRLSVLRKRDLAKRIRDEENQYAHIITEKGLQELDEFDKNPLKQGVIIMADKNDRETIEYTLPADLLDTIDEIAEDENRDVSDLVEELISEGLDSLFEEDSEMEEAEKR